MSWVEEVEGEEGGGIEIQRITLKCKQWILIFVISKEARLELN